MKMLIAILLIALLTAVTIAGLFLDAPGCTPSKTNDCRATK